MNPTPNFDFNGQQLRHVVLEGEPWFVATDVCLILGVYVYDGKPNAAHACRKLEADEKGLHRMHTPSGFQRTTIVSESGLYKLILRSDKETAKPFQNWVTREVLPAIRQTGGYLLNEDARETAHADTREAMPLPPEFLQVFQSIASALALPQGEIDRLAA